MKWRNHMLMAGSCAVLLNMHLAEVIYCTAAASLPDQLETPGGERIAAHRGLTHELLLWLAPLFFLMFFSNRIPPSALSVYADRILAPLHFRPWVFFLPGAFHLAGDFLTPRGIQIAGQRVGLSLFRTGQPAEYLVSALFVFWALIHVLPI
ncbi:MAG: metal-dependent hydrolase [Syntrophobacteraceae bacterium]